MDKKDTSLRKIILTVAVTAIVTACITTWIPNVVHNLIKKYSSKNVLTIKVFKDKESKPVHGVEVEVWPAKENKVTKAYHYQKTDDNGMVKYFSTPDEQLTIKGKLKEPKLIKYYERTIPNKESVTELKWDINLWTDLYIEDKLNTEINKSKVEAARTTSSLWMNIALAEVGTKELVGDQSNPRIIEYLHSIDKEANSDKIPWPSAFVNWVITKAGLQGNNSLRARSWLSWGQEISEPVFGAITILEGQIPGSGMVGFYLGIEDDDRIKLLGGNIHNQVTIASYPKSRVLGYRLPR